MKVTPSTKIQSNWTGFLREDKNKTNLFTIVADSIAAMQIPPGKEVISTRGASAFGQPLSASGFNELVSPHEEADTRIFVHITDMVLKCFSHINDKDNRF